MAVVASPLAPSLLLILTKNHVVHQLLLAIFTSYKAKDAARVEKDPLRLLAAWHALREPSRHYTNQTIGHHRVLLHFKFLQDFDARVNTELTRKENPVHGGWANELVRYQAKLKDNPSLSFQYPGSVAYEGSDQLVVLGLLREDQGWRRIRAIADEPCSTGFEQGPTRLNYDRPPSPQL